jgi:GT2 family glycosyltransferase
MALRFITATRSSQTRFEAESLLCRSLRRISHWSAIELQVSANNNNGLPLIYNQAIEAASAQDILVFVHDDVWIDDWFIAQRLDEALASFDVIGIAGNTRRTAQQQSWFLVGGSDDMDSPQLSGGIAHGDVGEAKVLHYGATPASVQLLDGVFLAARAGSLQNAGVRFDSAFDFHFYDTDFCRSCSAAGLRMGTWPIALTHASAGRYKTPAWNLAYQRYLSKWGE